MDRSRSSSPYDLSMPVSSTRSNMRDISSRIGFMSPRNIESSIPFDFFAKPLTTQRFDIDITEEKLIKLKEKIFKSKNNLNDCKKCFEYLAIIEDLEEITNLFSRSRVKLLNNFFELYINFQEEIRKNKDLIAKNQKLVQKIEGNLEALTDRKINNKLKSLKNEIKHKNQVINELNSKILNIEKYNEVKIAFDQSKVNSKELLEKEQTIYNMHKVIKENLPESFMFSAHDSCKECLKKEKEIDLMNTEISKQKEIINNLSKHRNMSPGDCKNPIVKAMIELKNAIIS